MPYTPTLIIRWLAWMLLVTLESVVGFPWLSLYGAGEWVFGFLSSTALFSLVFMTIVFSAAFSLPLTFAAILMMVIWQATLRTRKNTWQRWLVYLASAILVGIIRQVPLSAITIIFSILSFMIFFKRSGGRVLKQPWQTKQFKPLSEK